MSEIVERIIELQSLPEELHLFCPRNNAEDPSAVFFDEDIAGFQQDTDPDRIAERKRKVKEAEERKWKALEALQVLAFDGDDAIPYQTWTKQRMHSLMTSCDICVRVFHQSRAAWRDRLASLYEDEHTVDEFLQVIDKVNIDRIKSGLDEAKTLLSKTEPAKRGMRVLTNEAVYAFFEALSCDAFLRNDALLQEHFDEPFQMVQTKKRLKLQTYLPAMTRFLFSNNESRQFYAVAMWSSVKRNLMRSDFDWAVRDYLVEAIMRVQMSNLDLPFVAIFWPAVKLITTKLDKDLITHSLRGLDGDFYKLMLDHLSLRSEGYLDLVATITLLLEKAPVDFWQAMDVITPSTATVVEQLLNSPILQQILTSASEDNRDQMQYLDDAFIWVGPLVASLKPANLTPACKTCANILLGRFQSDHFSRISRERCFKEGLHVLEYSFRRMNEGRSMTTFVGQTTVNAMLSNLSNHINVIITSLKRFDTVETRADLQMGLSMIQQAFALECHSLSVERQLFEAKQPSPDEAFSSASIWKVVYNAIDGANMELATNVLVAGRNLIGLEPLFWKPGVPNMPVAVRRFNDRFKLLSQVITDVIDRLADLDASQLGSLFKQPTSASAIIAALFSSTQETRNSSVEVLKIISSQDERREALKFIIDKYYKNVIQGVADSAKQIIRKKAFAPSPSLLKTGSDIVDILCNSQDGIIRSRDLSSNAGEAGVTMTLWKSLWDTLSMIFRTTESWSNLGQYDKTVMMDFCRDTMQFAGELFDQYSILTTALKGTSADASDGSSTQKLQRELLEYPSKTMEGMARWLRLRDEFLSSKSVTLISKVLVRLRDVSVEVDPDTLEYIQKVLNGDVRAKLNSIQQVELLKALETHLGRSLAKPEPAVKTEKQGSISQWMSKGSTPASDRDRRSGDADARAKLMTHITPSSTAFQRAREAEQARKAATSKKSEEQKAAQQSEFKRKRQAEQERLKKERDAAILKARQKAGLSDTAEAGSGLEGLGVLGKEQAVKGEGLMHSSDESGDDDDDFDEELFGIKTTKLPKSGPKTNIVNEVKVQMPVKKRRVQRSVKDMRARLAPDLSSLHKTILSWNYFHEGDFPPNDRPDRYTAVPKTFRTPNEYQATFEPLLTLEAWQGFVKSREENPPKPYEVRIVSRASVDAFQEVSSTMTHNENKDIGVSDGDIVLLSQSKMPNAQDRTCLARVFRVQRKQAHIEVSYRVMPSNPLLSSLVPNGTVYGSKIQSITPLEREYGALVGLQYYDLCDEIVRAKPSPLLTYRDAQLKPLIDTYDVNKAQSKAIKSAIDNDAFTLIQGPPGSGKTKTIVAIVGAILSDSLRNNGTPVHVPGQAPRASSATKKLLVCAPSNAAVDELVMRFKNGVKTLTGQERNLSIVRLGRSDAINANVQDVTLEELVNKKLGVSNGSKGHDAEDARKIFQEHKECSEQLRKAREQLDSGTAKGDELTKLQDDVADLRRRKAQLGTRIDNVKDNERTASRNADIARRRAQEQVLSEAHVICATLSGSGHDMFQNLSIEFETVIVDEAAQCVEMSALIPLKYGCAKCILVGDPKQLPPTVFSKEAARFQYEQSLFVRMQGNHPDDVHLLDTQYRMHPDISLFPSQSFYDGRLLDGANMAGLRKRPWHSSLLLGPYRFFDVQGQQQAAPKGHSLINIAEINVALQLYNRLTSDFPKFDFRGKIGIITPYKSQLRELKGRFAQKYGPTITEDIDFNTTDAFQGRESEVIIFSCVRASPSGGIGFLQDIRRMNVGLTRAKSSLWVLGNSQSLMRGTWWKKLVEDAKSRSRYSEGDVLKMLSKHSSAYPAPKDLLSSYEHRDKEVKEDGMDDVKPEHNGVKQEHTSTNGTAKMHKRKASSSPIPEDEDIKQEYANDVDMPDAPSVRYGSSNPPSRTSTPTGYSSGPGPARDAREGSKSESATPVPPGATGAAAPSTTNDPLAGMAQAKPRIRKRAKAPVDPFIRRR